MRVEHLRDGPSVGDLPLPYAGLAGRAQTIDLLDGHAVTLEQKN
jgi:hypothetical protein